MYELDVLGQNPSQFPPQVDDGKSQEITVGDGSRPDTEHASSDKVEGAHFSVDQKKIILFDLPGVRTSGKDWIMGINMGGEYIYVEVDPAPALHQVVDVLNRATATGGEIQTILMSSRVAVRLFLEGKLNASDFEICTETDIDIGDEVLQPAVKLPVVNLGSHSVQVEIVDERIIGPRAIGALGREGELLAKYPQS